ALHAVAFDPTTHTTDATLNIGVSLAEQMIAYPEYFYLDLATSAAGSGLVRGYLSAASGAEFHATLRGTEEVVLADATARGSATFSVGTDGRVHYVIAMVDPAPSAVTSAALERGGLHVDGPIELDLLTAGAAVDVAAGTLVGDVVAPLAL